MLLGILKPGVHFVVDLLYALGQYVPDVGDPVTGDGCVGALLVLGQELFDLAVRLPQLYLHFLGQFLLSSAGTSRLRNLPFSVGLLWVSVGLDIRVVSFKFL